jgi:hypothetical protein
MDSATLQVHGFQGWIPLLDFPDFGCKPQKSGVYAVVYEAEAPVAWPSKSCGGWHKGRDPTVVPDQLMANWVSGSDIVYFGMTDRPLAKRINEFAKFGAGQAVGHYGGRLVWQLPEIRKLKVGWLERGDWVPRLMEGQLIAEFRRTYGKPPFANNPHLFGR